jgi:hypothetical protein
MKAIAEPVELLGMIVILGFALIADSTNCLCYHSGENILSSTHKIFKEACPMAISLI